MLRPITSTPTMSISGLRLILPTSMAPNGAAITPPTMSPKTTFQLSTPVKSMKVIPLAKATANSAAFTDPMV
ncbi:hypothetical protein D3C87_2081420 [compost metagenome]